MCEGQSTFRSIGEIADINPETLPANTPSNTRFRYVDLSAVKKGFIDWHAVGETTFIAAPSRARRVIRPRDALFGTVRPSLQSHGRVGAGEFGPLVASTGFSVIRARDGISDSAYLFHSIMSNCVTAQAERNAIGSSYPAVNDSDVKQLRIFLPALKAQERTAEVLDTLDIFIHETEAIIVKLKAVKQGLLHDLLTRGIDANGELRPPQVEAPHLYKTSPLGLIPSEWKVIQVHEAGSVKLGRQRSPAHEQGPHMHPYFRVANVYDGFIDYSDVLSMDFSPSEQEVFSVIPGDILLNEGQSLELVGRCALYNGLPGKYCFQNTLIRFRPCKDTAPSFARQVFKYWLDTGRFMPVAKQTTSVAHLGADRFAAMPFPAPSREEQDCIADRMNALTTLIQAEAEQLGKLIQQKSGLMDDLLTGRVRVTPLLEGATP